MIAEVRKTIGTLLESGRITGFLGLIEADGQIGPYLFLSPQELKSLSLGDRKAAGDSRYALNRQLIHLARQYPDKTFGVLVRGCDERSLKTLYVWYQLDPQKVVPVGINCPRELAHRCECLKPYPDQAVAGEKAQACSPISLAALERFDLEDRFVFWRKAFSKCIKCYGCRDVCPMCFCRECSLTTEALVANGSIPPENPIFHLVRAVHMAGRCIDCGLCNQACPADIPLRTLYKKVADILEQEFQFRAGYTLEQKSPLNVLAQGRNGPE